METSDDRISLRAFSSRFLSEDPHLTRLRNQRINRRVIARLMDRYDENYSILRQDWEVLLRRDQQVKEQVMDLVGQKDYKRLHKNELIHKKWNQQVYEPIETAVQKEMGSRRCFDLVRRRNLMYQSSLKDISKEYPQNFSAQTLRDIGNMVLHYERPGVLVARTGPLRDPLLHHQRARAEEEFVINECSRLGHGPQRQLLSAPPTTIYTSHEDRKQSITPLIRSRMVSQHPSSSPSARPTPSVRSSVHSGRISTVRPSPMDQPKEYELLKVKMPWINSKRSGSKHSANNSVIY